MKKYTKQAQKAINLAQKASDKFNHPYVGTEHLLLGLIKEESGTAARVLEEAGVEAEQISQLIIELIAPQGVESSNDLKASSIHFFYQSFGFEFLEDDPLISRIA